MGLREVDITIVLISTDSDAAPALQAIQEDFPHIMRGLILPVYPPSPTGGDKTRRKSGSLQMLSDWCQASISDAELQAAQLPALVNIPGKKIVRKPAHW